MKPTLLQRIARIAMLPIEAAITCYDFVDEFVPSRTGALLIKTLMTAIVICIIADMALWIAKSAFGVYTIFGLVV